MLHDEHTIVIVAHYCVVPDTRLGQDGIIPVICQNEEGNEEELPPPIHQYPIQLLTVSHHLYLIDTSIFQGKTDSRGTALIRKRPVRKRAWVLFYFIFILLIVKKKSTSHKALPRSTPDPRHHGHQTAWQQEILKIATYHGIHEKSCFLARPEWQKSPWPRLTPPVRFIVRGSVPHK